MINRVFEQDLAKIIAFNLPWHILAGKTVFISGASGFLPAYIVETLLFLNKQEEQLPVNIIGLVRNKEKALKRFEFYENRAN
jgi:UDP-glucuronate decarboxylase